MMTTIILDFQKCFIFIFLCFFSLLCYTIFFRKPKDFPLPPSPPSLPIIGHLHILLSIQIHRSLQKLSSKYGSILYLRIFSCPIVLVSSASAAYEIFRAHDVNISSRGFPPTEDSLFAGSFSFISAPNGDYWKFMRKVLVTNLLGPQALKRSQRIRADELDRFYNNLFEKAVNKETVEIFEEAFTLTNNSICKLIMGRCCPEEEGVMESVKGLATELDDLSKTIMLANLLPPWLQKLVLSLFKKELKVILNSFNELLEKILVEHEEKQGEHLHDKDLMDVLLEAYGDENASYKITRNHIKSFCVDLLFAGTTTPAIPIPWILAEIIKSPKTLERLREELDSVVGTTRLIQETDLPNLPYLEAVVKEGLRLHPPEPIFERFSQEGCMVGGFYVPEKTTLMVNAYALMRDPNYWENPDEFQPERFLDTWKDESKEQALKYIPFGSGRRGCPGENVSHIFMGTAIGVMVQGFEWRFKEEEVNMEEAIVGLSLTMAHPLKLTPIARNPNSLILNLKSRG
ncbi:hypothetical protein IGI04_015756 [Brassica rapa subsp. trilocularis]|uniref:Cytochrome P450 n=1 Tax=Brassica rapa subsp. trilocularis TaxID=1813537 RepID=A0ABQ7MR00_BRACM|nr:hypothetical protein IGI04_015756 [Brassica rapa subsp. trilocularis]